MKMNARNLPYVDRSDLLDHFNNSQTFVVPKMPFIEKLLVLVLLVRCEGFHKVIAILKVVLDSQETSIRVCDNDALAGNVAGNCRFWQFLRIVSRTITQMINSAEFKSHAHLHLKAVCRSL